MAEAAKELADSSLEPMFHPSSSRTPTKAAEAHTSESSSTLTLF
jgi:hypothetical protein